MGGRVRGTAALCVRASESRMVSMSSGLSERSSIRSMSSPSAYSRAETARGRLREEVGVEPVLCLDLGQDRLALLEAVQVGEDCHRAPARHRVVRRLVHQLALVDRHALADGGVALGLLHHLDGQEEEAGAVVADHRLGHPVGGVGRGGGANLEARDAHDVRVEGLRVLRAQRLVGERRGDVGRCGEMEMWGEYPRPAPGWAPCRPRRRW